VVKLAWLHPSKRLDRADPLEAQRVERLLGASRLILAVASLLAVYVDPTEPARFSGVCYALLIAYSGTSALAYFAVRARPAIAEPLAPWLYGLDVLLPTVITIFTTGPSSPFFVLFTFVVFGAAYRWGLQATVDTAALMVVLLLMQAVFLARDPALGMALEVNRLVIRSSYLLLIGFLVGFLADREQQRRAESAVLARVLAAARPEHGLAAALAVVAHEVLETFDMTTALVVLREMETGRVFLWQAERDADSNPGRASVLELDNEQRAMYLFDLPHGVDAWHSTHATRPAHSVVLNAAGERMSGVSIPVPPGFSAAHEWRSQLGARVTTGEDWDGRLFLLDPAAKPIQERRVRFLQMLCTQVHPALYSAYLIRRLRARAGAIERARVARELHDGVIQGLVSLQLQLETLRRRTASAEPWIPETIEHIQEQLHGEVLNVRDLMQHLRPPVASSGRIVELIAEQVERFGRHTGLHARLISDLRDLRIAPRLCEQLTQIVHEALVNVRKHSGARNVVVWFEARNGFWRLAIDDDGQGFSFDGQLTLEELDQQRRGPVVIRDRVRAIRGRLTIDSQPGRGARLEILVPQGTR
jgi:signal transduction histidine kinase